jgi:hypothetical protein
MLSYSASAYVTTLGGGEAGLVEVLDVPEQLRSSVPEGLAASSFLAHNDDAVGVDLFICRMGGVPMEFMATYQGKSVAACNG